MPKKKSSKSSHVLSLSLGFLIGGLCSVLLIGLLLSPIVDFNPKWQEPERIRSNNGVLDVELLASESAVAIGGQEKKSKVYNTSYLSKTWEIQGGDTIRVHLKNNLQEPTNLHFHGGHLSPKGSSDNVLLSILPGEKFDYEYNLPKNHPAGLYWYHPHYHPYTDTQVMGGMAGAIIIRGAVDQLPGIKGVPERLLLLTTQDRKDLNTPQRLVNGVEKPTLYLRPWQSVRMSVVNAGSKDFYNLAIPGYKLHIFSRDGNTLDKIQSVDNEVLAPGQRVEFLFTPEGWGEIPVKTLPFNQGSEQYDEETVMTIISQGFPMLATPLPEKLLPYEDLRDAAVDKTRTLVFSEAGTMKDTVYLLDGKTVDMQRIDQTMVLGTTEEWKLVNNSFEEHPFHIHINPFQVISVNGKPVDLHGYRDTVRIPAHGEVVIRTQYKDFDGKFVLHCHILFHEDHGMMQVVEIVPPGKTNAKDNGVPEREMQDHTMHQGH